MNIKLKGFQDLLGDPSNPRKFGHNIISKENPLDAKKMFRETQKWQNILLITKFENVEKMHCAHVLDAQMAAMRRVAWLCFCVLHTL